MARKGGNKRSCDKYKNSGRKQENKLLKQKRHEKRMARFAKRREDGVSYKYDKSKTERKIVGEYDISLDSNYYKNHKEEIHSQMFAPNKESNCARHTTVSKWRSVMKKVNDEFNKKKAEMKKRESATRDD